MIFEKIRERLQEKKQSIEQNMFGNEDDMVYLSDAIDIINQVEAEYNNGWIPCSERLPNFDEDVLLYISSYEMQMGYKDIQAFGEVVFYMYNSQDFVDLEEVIAWMPLPEPYIPKADKFTEPDWKSSVMNHFMKGE